MFQIRDNNRIILLFQELITTLVHIAVYIETILIDIIYMDIDNFKTIIIDSKYKLN